MGAGARTTPQVAAQLAQKADRLSDLSKTGAAFLSANRASRAANMSARAAALSRPAANMGEAAARFGSRVGESVVKGAGYGAVYGGLYGMGSAEGGIPERLDETAEGAAFGAVGGAVLSPAAQFVLAPIAGKVGYSMFTSLDDKALDRVLERAARSGTSLQKVRADFDAWKKTGEVPETLAELMGPHERSLLSAMITVNRETEERAGEILLGRGKKEVDRLEKSFARAMGAGRGDFASAREGAKKARAQDPTPLYDSAHYDQNGTLRALDPQKQADLNNILIDEDDVITILKDAKADLNRSGNKGARDEVVRYMEAVQDLRAGKQAQLPNLSVQAADYIERAINDAFKTAGAGTGKVSGGVRGWGMLRDAVRNIIDDTGVGAARATAAERIRRGELLDEGRNFLEKSVDIEDITDTLRGNPALGIDPASPAGQQAYTVGAARAIGDTLRDTQDMKGFADATRKVARTPAIREKVNAVLPQGKLTKKGAPDLRSRQTKLNQQLERDIERTADRADFTNNMLGNSRTAFRQGAVQDAMADDQFSTAIGEGVRDLLLGGPGGLVQNAAGRFAKGVSARIGQPGVMRPGLNRKMADILLATDKDIPVQIARLAARAAQRANSRVGRAVPVLPAAGQTKPPRGTPPTPPPTPQAAQAASAGPIRAAGFGGGEKPTTLYRGAAGDMPTSGPVWMAESADYAAQFPLGDKAGQKILTAEGSGKILDLTQYPPNATVPVDELIRALELTDPAAIAALQRSGQIFGGRMHVHSAFGLPEVQKAVGAKYAGARMNQTAGTSEGVARIYFDAGALSPSAARSQGLSPLRGDLGNALAGAGLGALGPADSNEERLRNMAVGAGIGFGARRVGRAFGAEADDVATAGFGAAKNKSAKSSAVWFDDAGDEIAEFPEKPGLELIIGRDGHVSFTLGGQIAKSPTDKAGSASEIVNAINLVVPAIRQHANSPSARGVYSFDGSTPEHVNVYRRLLARGIGGDMNVFEATRGGRFYVTRASKDQIEKAFGTVRQITEQDARPLVLSKKDRLNRLSPWNVSPPESPILTAGVGGPRKPVPPRTPGKSKLGTRTADAAAVAALASAPPAQADTVDPRAEAQARIDELSQNQAAAQELITEYEQSLKDFEALSPTDKQIFLKDNGYTGPNGEIVKPDGDVRGITGFAIAAYKKELNDALAAQKVERDNYKNEINDIRVALAQRPEKQTNPLIDKLTEYGTYGAVAYLAHRGRGAMVKASQVSANRAAAKANALLTRLPVPPEAPKKTLLSRVPIVGAKDKARIAKETKAANKAQFATEERLAGRDIPPISPDPNSPDGLPNRLANVDEFDRQRAAGDFGPVGRLGRLMEPVNSRFRGGDLAVIGTGAADTYITEGMIQKTRADIETEEKKLAKALADDDPDAIGLSTKRLEQLRQAETVQVILQRIGIGMMIGGGFGLTHGRYARPQPRFEAAARERDLINRAMVPPPAAAAPIAPPQAPLSLPAPAAVTRPRLPPTPKPKPPVSFSRGKPRKPSNDND
jgi:hypothetical protein